MLSSCPICSHLSGLVAVFLSFIRTRASHEGACMMIGTDKSAENQYGADSVCFLYRMFLPDVTQKITLNARGLCGNLHSGYLEKRPLVQDGRRYETKDFSSNSLFRSLAWLLRFFVFKSSGIGCTIYLITNNQAKGNDES